MKNRINDLVSLHDTESLYELMIASDDELLQLDAAEGLVKLADERGLKYMENALGSDDKNVRDYARDILESPDMQRWREQVEAESDRRYQASVDAARKRLQAGKKVFRYKVIFLPAVDVLQEDYGGDGVSLPDLNLAGLAGWEVVNLVPRRQLMFDVNDRISGAYALLKKEVAPDESAELDEE